jgi:hypothetical protein
VALLFCFATDDLPGRPSLPLLPPPFLPPFLLVKNSKRH